MPYSAVIFDLFGTLIGTFAAPKHDGVLTAMAETLGADHEAFRRLWNVEIWRERFTGRLASVEATVEDVLRALHVEAPVEQMAAAARLRLVASADDLLPRPDAISTLEALRRCGYKLGLISDCSAEVPLLWGETPFAKLIDEAIFSCTAGVCKPDPAIYQLACERLKVEPGECWYVGDGSSQELTGARRFGMTPILYRIPLDTAYDQERPELLNWVGPEIEHLSQLLDLVCE